MDDRQTIRAIALILSIYGVQIAVFPGPTIRVAVQLVLFSIVLFLFIAKSNLWRSFFMDSPEILGAFFVYGCVCLVRGMYAAETYEQWRYLVTVFLPTILLPIFSLIGTKPALAAHYLKYIFVFGAPLSCIFFFKGPGDKQANLSLFVYVSFIFPLITIAHIIPMRGRIILITLSILSFLFDMKNRSNMASIFLSAIIFFTAFGLMRAGAYGGTLLHLVLKWLRYGFMFTPIALCAAAAFVDFNIFQFIDGSESPRARDVDGALLTTIDSRTNIYIDAYYHMIKTGDWIFGSGPVVQPDTTLADSSEDYINGRLGGSESSFLAYLLFGGIFYVTGLFAIFLRSTYLAIHCSNSWTLRLIGTYLSVRWAFTFVENPLDFNNYWSITFLLIGICLSPAARLLSDADISRLVYWNNVIPEQLSRDR